MEVKKVLEKYFKGAVGASVLKHSSRNDINKYLLEKILETDSGKYVAKKQRASLNMPDFVMIDSTNYSQTFLDSFWKNLTFEQRIKSINYFIEESNRTRTRYNPVKLSLIQPVGVDDSSMNACYIKRSNEIFLNLDNLDNISGIEMYSILVHETTHARDFNKLRTKIIPELSKQILGREVDDAESMVLMYQILEIENQDAYRSAIDGRMKKIDTDLRSNITLAKNYAYALTPTPIHSIEQVDSIESFADYAQYILYLHSPVERGARLNALIETQKLVEESPIDDVDNQDQLDLTNLEDRELYYNNEINRFKGLLDIPVRKSLEDSFKYGFIKENYSLLSPMLSIGEEVQDEFPNIQREHISTIRRAYSKYNQLTKKENEC